jgi:hypothetical protein
MKPEAPNELDVLLDDACDVVQYLIFSQDYLGWVRLFRLAIRRRDVRKELDGYMIYWHIRPKVQRILQWEHIKDLTISENRVLRYVEEGA